MLGAFVLVGKKDTVGCSVGAFPVGLVVGDAEGGLVGPFGADGTEDSSS